MSICGAVPMQGSPGTSMGIAREEDHQRQIVQRSQPSSTANRSAPIVPTPTTTALQWITTKVPVLLQTARVHVFNPANPAMSD